VPAIQGHTREVLSGAAARPERPARHRHGMGLPCRPARGPAM